MFRASSRRAAVAAALVAAVGLLPATSVFALGPTGADTVTAPVDPGPVTTSVTAPSLSLDVVSDSVVATATVHYTGSAPDLIVAWGDGARTRTSPPIASLPGRPVPTAGSVVFQHVFAEGFGFPFISHVSVISPVSGRELIGRNVGIIPRYRVTQHAVEFSPLNHCDSIAEAYTEWVIQRPGGVLPYKEWHVDRHTADIGGVGVPLPDFQPLPDSAVTFETTAAGAPTVSYRAYEADPLVSEFFDPQFVDFNPRLGSRTVTLTYHEKYGADCHFQIRTPIDVQLLKPGLASGPVASQ
jgi:hypothetical protein